MQGPSASRQVPFCQVKAPSPSLGGAGPMVLFCLALGSPAPQTAYRLPDILQPLCLFSCGASSWVTSPSQVGPVRVHSLPGFKARTCFLSFQELFSHSLPHSLEKLRCPLPAGCLALCGPQHPGKSASHCISVSVCRLPLLPPHGSS